MASDETTAALSESARLADKAASRAMRALLLLKLLLITVAAVASAYYAIGSVNVGGIHSSSLTDADLIRQRCPIRLVQPEWVSSQPDTLMNWLVAETIAREGLVTALWLGSLSIVVWQYFRKRRDTHAA